jgi:hypothetical protein
MRKTRTSNRLLLTLCLCTASHMARGEDAAPPAEKPSAALSLSRQGAWFIADSQNFQVCSLRNFAEAQAAALYCEVQRAALINKWNAPAASRAWSPRCQVVLHNSFQGYVRAVGRGSENTLGSSLIWPGRGQINTRKIDIRAEGEYELASVMPHELTHLVLADRFGGRSAPLWFDEGSAILADPESKQKLHQRDLVEGLKNGSAFPLVEFMTMKEYPSADRVAVFYGQCAALAKLFLKLGSADQSLRFIEESEEDGATVALRDVYGIKRPDVLDTMWRSEVGDASPTKIAASVSPLAPLTAAPLAVLAP